MEEIEDDVRQDRSIVQVVIDYLLLPLRIATSPALLRTYLRTALFFIASTILFGFAVVAYSSFYYAYIPVRGIVVPVYLQYDHAPHSLHAPTQVSSVVPTVKPAAAKWPYGLANIPGLVARQKYDVVVELDLPRSETNLRAGNWMVGLEFRGPTTRGQGVKHMLGWDEEWNVEDHSQGGVPGTTAEKNVVVDDTTTTTTTTTQTPTVLARSKRPAILTYRSRVLEMMYRLMRLPLYLLGWHKESEHVRIKMMESVMFESGYRNIPSSLRLELRSKLPLEVYRASVHMTARLEGIRWLMYRYRILAAALGILGFWGVEMGVLLFTWGAFTLLTSSLSSSSRDGDGDGDGEEGKKEERRKVEAGETDPGTPFSETSRVFPTLPSQYPLSYSSSGGGGGVKREDGEVSLKDIPVKEEAEADDEDEDFLLEVPLPVGVEREAVFTDSGLGTGLESGIERGSARRRGVKGE
ncbi:hypothetical protein COCMIDRAFT_27662 [Bipolaris oryzae ATCC 44560]|uniref:Seipin n=1 Tax=Bipolaris oryzae ATCC 44560 TaxID=930090 RepID=W6Z1R8_COCMI|nr:uncharacterized protein COCMIDRAFT_27662 [Bipolaris oryzae ATCC 44560]EUC43910.1 hypothetical protein COCMIDRAFT_27662 [Bipolaris oryzae ATCC 44560]